MNLKKLIQNYKKRKPLAIISDLLLILLLVIVLVPSLRREVGSKVVRVIMTKPDIEAGYMKQLSQKDLHLVFEDNNGHRYRLQEFLDKPVFLTYWATWCHHCVAELPNLNSLHEKTRDSINIIMLVHEDVSKVNEYLGNKGYVLPVYKQLTAPGQLLQSKKIPASFVIDKKGNLRHKETGATKWDTGTFISFIQSL